MNTYKVRAITENGTTVGTLHDVGGAQIIAETSQEAIHRYLWQYPLKLANRSLIKWIEVVKVADLFPFHAETHGIYNSGTENSEFFVELYL